ncbi:hypothetical protein MIND_00420900 [Mycena indigotica]|uniref:Uncharacterized protein n=1 Tax=Mycena indigotica TaxID=2126181 RepID=A0A8H6W599_9AGAR|nr:uncharacterized protein MIND_00420900 [Mycena indigotica]KAF7306299.1 hypothetical protein MIND_00420900 [Mycena indigotica]
MDTFKAWYYDSFLKSLEPPLKDPEWVTLDNCTLDELPGFEKKLRGFVRYLERQIHSPHTSARQKAHAEMQCKQYRGELVQIAEALLKKQNVDPSKKRD